jgi:hypothetical protein
VPFLPGTLCRNLELEFGLECGVNDESALRGASLGVDTISGNLALRVVRNSLAGDPHSSVGLGSGWRSLDALRAFAQWIGYGG